MEKGWKGEVMIKVEVDYAQRNSAGEEEHIEVFQKVKVNSRSQ